MYETIGTAYGRLFAAKDHLVRLERSAERIGLRAPPRADIEKAIAETIAAAGNPESRVRVMLTRGAGKLDLDPASSDDTQLIVIVFPLGAPTPEMYDKGVAVAIVSITRNNPRAMDPAVKSGNYLNNVLALGEARRRNGAYEAILCADDGCIAEGSTSNIFIVREGEIWTPPPAVGILDGITRAKVLQLCRDNGVAFQERRFSPDDLRGADEAFITSATRGVLPVTVVDEKPVGGGAPGPVTRRLMSLYDQLARRGVD
ncbi:MAG TPA: aminotransferase class IV [Polyangia bacterium]|nr:aminotransferase class IV [Polyangia bacterium]